MPRKKKVKEVVGNEELNKEIIQTETIVEQKIEENASIEQLESSKQSEQIPENEIVLPENNTEVQEEKTESKESTEPQPKQRKPRTKKEKPIVEDTISDDEFSQLEAEMSKANSINTNVAPTKTRKSKPVEGLITGYIVLYVCDIVFPVGIAWVSKSMFHSEIPSKALKLTGEQWKRLEPIADEAVKGLIVTIQPQWALVILLGLSYFENAVSFTPKPIENVKYNKRRSTKSRKNNQSKGNS